MKKAFLMPVFAAFAATAVLPACTETTRTTESTGEYLDSAAITSKVKTAIVRDSGLKGFQINVETFKDEVQLSGFVDTPQQRTRATELAQTVPGVRAVRNDIVVK